MSGIGNLEVKNGVLEVKIKMGETMRLRLPERLLQELQRASAHYDKMDYSTIAEKALYAVWRRRPDLAAITVESTYGGEAIRLCISESCWLQNGGMVPDESRPDFLRRALSWHLARLDYKPQSMPQLSGLTPGVDFWAVEVDE